MSRKIKRREAARVVVVADGCVLLVNDTDPGVSGSSWWVTPGGGVDAGESPRESAARELFEETGLAAESESMGPCVMRRDVVHGYSDRILVQREHFYRLEAERFDPQPAALTVAERGRMAGIAWAPLAQLPAPLWPSQLPELAAGAVLGDIGWVEESTVAVSEQVLNSIRDA